MSGKELDVWNSLAMTLATTRRKLTTIVPAQQCNTIKISVIHARQVLRIVSTNNPSSLHPESFTTTKLQYWNLFHEVKMRSTRFGTSLLLFINVWQISIAAENVVQAAQFSEPSPVKLPSRLEAVPDSHSVDNGILNPETAGEALSKVRKSELSLTPPFVLKSEDTFSSRPVSNDGCSMESRSQHPGNTKHYSTELSSSVSPTIQSTPSSQQTPQYYSKSDYPSTNISTKEQQQQQQLFYEMPQVTEKDLRVASGVATGVCGTLFLGPVAGTCLGFGAAYAVSQKRDNFWKDSARALGEVSILAHARAQAIDEKYHVVENSLLAVQGAWEKLRSWSHYQPEAVDQSKEMVVSCCVSAREFCTKHRLVKRGAYMTTQAAFWLGQSLDRALAERRGVRQGRTDSLTAQR